MRPERWENGSEFHWAGWPGGRPPGVVPWSQGSLLASGRDALRLLLSHGVRRRGWRRLWVPEYYCQRVTAALVRPSLQLLAYPDSPLHPTPELPDARVGDAVLVVNYFGLRAPMARPYGDGVDVVEDHSHDPLSSWATHSAADFCVVSLRKTVPLPDGGAMWSPRGHALPSPPRLGAQRTATAGTRLAGMVLKAMYLDGHAVDKAAFRSLLQQAERGLDVPGVSSISPVSAAMLVSLPVAAWRRRRAANHAQLASRVADLGWARVLEAAASTCVPFSCVLVADTPQRRERVRRRLIDAMVYPAVLWPLEETVVPVGIPARALSRRLLSIHCDWRYGAEDMERVAVALLSADRRTPMAASR